MCVCACAREREPAAWSCWLSSPFIGFQLFPFGRRQPVQIVRSVVGDDNRGCKCERYGDRVSVDVRARAARPGGAVTVQSHYS